MSAESDWKWTPAREEAATLVAADEITDTAIAAQVRINQRTLTRWKLAPEFRERVAAHVEVFRAVVRSKGIAILEKRVAALDDRWRLLRTVIVERAAAAASTAEERRRAHAWLKAKESGAPAGEQPDLGAQEALGTLEEFAEAPGMLTGMMVRQVKALKLVGGEGPPKTVFVDEYVVDAGLTAEIRAHEKQAAQELRQWTEQADVTSGGRPIGAALLEDLTDDELDRRLADAEARKAAKVLPG